MVRTLRTLMLAGRGEVTQKDARDLVATWTKRATDRRSAFANQVRELVRQELKLNQVTRDEFDALAELVARLERRTAPPEDAPVRR